jgi:hypothetical protein
MKAGGIFGFGFLQRGRAYGVEKIQGISEMKYSPGESFSTAARISVKCLSKVGR